VAESDFTVVSSERRAPGKEVIARAIHQTSPRSKGPFIPVDCGAIPDNLWRVSFLAMKRGLSLEPRFKSGKFELAEGNIISG